MNNNVNVINNVGKDILVTVNNKGRNTQIIINLADNKIELSTLLPGDIFISNGVEYIVLEQFKNGTTGVITKELLKDNIKFDSDINNWKTSNIRRKLNEEYLKELVFGEDNIVEHTIDLLSLDGLNDYGTSKDKISLLTIDQYRKYRKILGENKDKWWWLLTPDSTPTGYGSGNVQYVNSSGDVSCGWCCGVGGVRPFFVLKSDIFVSCDKVEE